MDDGISRPATEMNKLISTGRTSRDLPGAGGNSSNPTRIVINHLYDRHGSKNLFLHEHGHALDSVLGKASSKANWERLFKDKQNSEFFQKLCTEGYCSENPDEAFAESFAYYTACAGTRQQMEFAVPGVAQYFEDLINQYK